MVLPFRPLRVPPGQLSGLSGAGGATVMEECLGGARLEVAEGLLDRVTALKDAGVIGRTTLRVFLMCRILPLKARPALLWEYIGPRDQSMVVDAHLPEESLTGVVWMVLRSASGDPSVDGRPALFLVFEPRPDDLPYFGVASVAPSPRG